MNPNKIMDNSKITIYPVTRIEGHAKITIHLDDNSKVDKVIFSCGSI